MTNGALADLLAAWLPRQRWFACAGTGLGAVEIISDVRLADGDPELRHLIVAAQVAGEMTSYQLLLGCRRVLPGDLEPARIGTLPDGRIGYDGAYDPALTAVVLAGIAAGRQAGPLRFGAEPGARIDPGAAARMLPQTHSNTSIVFGDRAILKLLRRPYGGHHPDLEVPAALARSGSRLVAAPLGWLEFRPGEPFGEPAVLAILSEFFPNAGNGWALATASVAAGPDAFAQQARLLGQVTAKMHAELTEAFGSATLSPADLAALSRTMTSDLDRAVALVPGLAAHAAAIRACYADLPDSAGPVAIQRIHGDYHLGQVLHTARGWIVLDFEGEPSEPLASRRAMAPALRDVAGMLRSFDYAGRRQALARAADWELADHALDWVRHCQGAFTGGYAEQAGEALAGSGPLLRALTFQKAVYEAVYEARHRPDWLPIPLAAIAEAGT
jgi:maltokinase